MFVHTAVCCSTAAAPRERPKILPISTYYVVISVNCQESRSLWLHPKILDCPRGPKRRVLDSVSSSVNNYCPQIWTVWTFYRILLIYTTHIVAGSCPQSVIRSGESYFFLPTSYLNYCCRTHLSDILIRRRR